MKKDQIVYGKVWQAINKKKIKNKPIKKRAYFLNSTLVQTLLNSRVKYIDDSFWISFIPKKVLFKSYIFFPKKRDNTRLFHKNSVLNHTVAINNHYSLDKKISLFSKSSMEKVIKNLTKQQQKKAKSLDFTSSSFTTLINQSMLKSVLNKRLESKIFKSNQHLLKQSLHSVMKSGNTLNNNKYHNKILHYSIKKLYSSDKAIIKTIINQRLNTQKSHNQMISTINTNMKKDNRSTIQLLNSLTQNVQKQNLNNEKLLKQINKDLKGIKDDMKQLKKGIKKDKSIGSVDMSKAGSFYDY